MVDRLLHHAHVVLSEGQPVRLADAMADKGVVPLARHRTGTAADPGARACPSPGRPSGPPWGQDRGRRWGKLMAATGEILMAIDTGQICLLVLGAPDRPKVPSRCEGHHNGVHLSGGGCGEYEPLD